MINQERLWSQLTELGEIGRNEEFGSITRLSFTQEERSAKDFVTYCMEKAGLTVREDSVGNLIGRKEGSVPGAPVIMIGSHIDTVHKGGMFDGALGVISGIEVLRTMEEQSVSTECPIEVVAFTDEEGSRFGFGMIGSRAMVGTLDPSMLERTDEEGVSIAEAMANKGLDPDFVGEAARSKSTVRAYVELHIEQGKILENEGHPVGVVKGIAGNIWRKFVIEGESGHAGTTPMKLRRDALAAAVRIVQMVEEEAGSTDSTVGTVGRMEVSPGGTNVIPSKVEFVMDLRDLSEEVRDKIDRRVLENAQKLCLERDVKMHTKVLQKLEAVPCSELVQNVAEEVAYHELGQQPFTLTSGAAHDALKLKELCPIGMIFVRSKEGMSHSPKEWSSKQDCAVGANVLYGSVLSLAGKV